MTEPAFRNEKYEATGETKLWLGVTLHRIRAVRDIAALGIVAGALGGWIEKSDNLEVSGNAWVYGDAWVSGNAWVYGDARVYGNARVSGNAWVYGDAQVSGNARVYGDASQTPVHISGLTWAVTISDKQMVIGCQHHDIAAWLAFSDREIIAMDRGALKFWRTYKPVIEAICKETGRPFADAPVEAVEA